MPDRPRKPQATRPSKLCLACGRAITWRKKWERDWDNIRFCSDRCRQAAPPRDQNHALEQAILHLLAVRGRDKTICPSEAARAVAAQLAPAPAPSTTARAAWEPLLEPARAAARRLVAAGRILITQGGHPVDSSTAKGPIRLKLR